MSVGTVVEWFVERNTCFLLGAGCSASAGKPLMPALTSQVRAKVPLEIGAILDGLQGTNGRAPNVEDLINYLSQLHRVTSASKGGHGITWGPDELQAYIAQIQEAIVEAVGQDWTPSPVHERFLQRMTLHGSGPIDIFCLNYDTCIEATLEAARLSYTDGFCGAQNAFFDPTMFDLLGERRLAFRLYKLHGSVNWVRDATGVVRRAAYPTVDPASRAMVYPAEQKLVQTQYGVYETLLQRFRDRLRTRQRNNTLIVLGYSFGDEHINVAIEQSLHDMRGDLTVHAFVGPETDIGTQEARLRKIWKGLGAASTCFWELTRSLAPVSRRTSGTMCAG
jgi:hypothetical protein